MFAAFAAVRPRCLCSCCLASVDVNARCIRGRGELMMSCIFLLADGAQLVFVTTSRSSCKSCCSHTNPAFFWTELLFPLTFPRRGRRWRVSLSHRLSSDRLRKQHMLAVACFWHWGCFCCCITEAFMASRCRWLCLDEALAPGGVHTAACYPLSDSELFILRPAACPLLCCQ